MSEVWGAFYPVKTDDETYLTLDAQGTHALSIVLGMALHELSQTKDNGMDWLDSYQDEVLTDLEYVATGGFAVEPVPRVMGQFLVIAAAFGMARQLLELKSSGSTRCCRH